jgi:hypothetical protein
VSPRTGRGCRVIENVLEEESNESTQAAALPQCAIRSTCRWYSERGAADCEVCPLVVTDIGGKETYRSVLASQAHD